MNWSTLTYSQPNSTSYVSLDTSFSGGERRASFTGKELDEETGYGYFGARYMDHELMTGWLSVDPMSDKYPSMSPYAYCAWNPVKLVDPDRREVGVIGANNTWKNEVEKRNYVFFSTNA